MDINYMRDVSLNMIKQAQEACEGPHWVIFDDSSMEMLDRITPGYCTTRLKENGCQNFLKFKSPLPPYNRTNTPLLFVVQPDLEKIRVICNHRKAQLLNNSQRRVVIACLPKVPAAAVALVEEEGLLCPEFSLIDLAIPMCPIDKDLSSLELNSLYSNLFANGDLTQLEVIADAIHCIENVTTGPAPIWHLFGDAADSLFQLCEKMRTENPKPMKLFPGFGQVVLFSRNVDLVTPLCLQQIYSGCVDDLLNIKNGAVKYPKYVDEAGRKMILSHEHDAVFAMLSDLHIWQVPQPIKTLNLQNKTVSKTIKKNMQGTVQEMSEYGKRLEYHTKSEAMSARHTRIMGKIYEHTHGIYSEWLTIQKCLLVECDPSVYDLKIYSRNWFSEYIADGCIRCIDPLHLLRLLCLHSQCSKPLVNDELEHLEQLFCQSFGFQYITAFEQLRAAGLLLSKEQADLEEHYVTSPMVRKSGSNFKRLRSKLDLIEDNSLKAVLACKISRITSGECKPLGIHLMQLALNQNQTNKRPQNSSALSSSAEALKESKVYTCKRSSSKRYNAADANSVLFVFIGGCTYSEIAGVRQVAKEANLSAYILTSGIINCTGLIRQLCPLLN